MQLFLTILGFVGIAGCILWLILFLRKKPKNSMIACVLLALVVFVADVTLQLTPKPAGGAASQPDSAPAGSGTSFQADFVGGYYTPGIDFPAGSYTITVLEGSGTIYHTEPSGGGKKYEVSAGKSNLPAKIELPIGEVLSVSGVKIHMESSNAEPGTLSERDNPATKEVTLAPGTYLVGKEFAEGIYDITAQSGKGRVTCDSIASGINNELDAAGTDYQKTFKNLILDDTTKLTVTGATVKLTPSK